MYGDYHIHTMLCNHATGAMEEYVEQARARGLHEFGFSEHSPWMVQSGKVRNTMLWEELPGYVEKVKQLDADYGEAHNFRVRLGMEMDFVPARLDQAHEIIGRYDWDYLIGSIHHLGLFCLPSRHWAATYDRYTPEQISEVYFEHVGMMVRERFCDVIGHLDVIKKHGHRPAGGHMRWIEPLIPKIREAGMAVEINTSGLDYVAGEVFPAWDIIEALNAGGVPLMLNSDSHAPDQVARHFEPVMRQLLEVGVKELARFEKRNMISYQIKDYCPVA